MYKLKKYKRSRELKKFLGKWKFFGTKKTQDASASDPEKSLSSSERIAKLNTEESKLEARKLIENFARVAETKSKLEDEQAASRKDSRKYHNALLEVHSAEKTKKKIALQKIVEQENGSTPTLEKIFTIDSFDKEIYDWEKRRESCLYQLFMLFTKPVLVETENSSNKVLEWLATEERIEQIILGKDSISMIHWLIADNNLAGVKWCFEWYRKQNYNTKKIRELVFETTDKYQNYWFDYLADGLVTAIEGGTYPEAEVIQVMLDEYEKSFADTALNPAQQRELVDEKQAIIKSLLLEKTEMTFNLEEYFTNKEKQITDPYF